MPFQDAFGNSMSANWRGPKTYSKRFKISIYLFRRLRLAVSIENWLASGRLIWRSANSCPEPMPVRSHRVLNKHCRKFLHSFEFIPKSGVYYSPNHKQSSSLNSSRICFPEKFGFQKLSRKSSWSNFEYVSGLISESGLQARGGLSPNRRQWNKISFDQ